MTSIKSLTSFKLDLPPSCIEFFPLKPNIAVIGTYHLEKSAEDSGERKEGGEVGAAAQSRNGSLVLVRVGGDNVYVISLHLFLSLGSNSRRIHKTHVTNPLFSATS